MRRCRRVVALALAIASAAIPVSAAGAAPPEPGVPLPIAPGVPSNGRAWELVTPADSMASLVFTPLAFSRSGDRVAYWSLGPLPGTAYGQDVRNIAVRGPAGWVNTPLGLPRPQERQESSWVFAYDDDASSSLWMGSPPGKDGWQTRFLYRRDAFGAFDPVADIGGNGDVVGASADLKRVFVRSSNHLVPADAARPDGLTSMYVVDGTTVRLVEADGAPLLSTCGSNLPGWDAVSDDGRRAVFTGGYSCQSPPLYLWDDGIVTEISASQCSLPECGPQAGATFVGMTPSGSSIFMVTTVRLTADDLSPEQDLYRYDTASGELELISGAIDGDNVVAPGNPVRVSADGSRFFFEGYTDDGAFLFLSDQRGVRAVAPAPGPFTQMSGNARYLAFITLAQLSAADTDERPDVYRYDAETGASDLVSSGGAANDGEFFALELGRTNEVPGDIPKSLDHRVISDDGSRIFFWTAEQLLPEDLNEVIDIYEWHEGSLGLVSSGAAKATKSVFYGATPDGSSALLETSDTLLPLDRDNGQPDYYVARLGGGFPEGAAPPACAGSSCQRASGGPAQRPRAASAEAGARIGLRLPGPAARRRIAASGWITLLAEAPQPGQLTATARARVGKRLRTVAGTVTEVAQPGPVRLRMRLSKPARQVLAAGDDLRLRLRLRLAGLAEPRRAGFELRAPR
jgi:hypothetical protein